jgi:hypothetical protein
MTDTYRVRRLRRAMLSASGGVLLTALLFTTSAIATRLGALRLSSALFMLLFWTAGIFGSFFDWFFGTKSYWLPNSYGFLAALVFDIFVLSLFSCGLLWLVEQFRHVGDLDDV